MSGKPIGSYGLLSDRHSAALVARDGDVDWLCLPRFDSPSVFGALLDSDAGHWSLRPEGDFEVTREYVDRTMVLCTTFRAASGTVRITDALATGPGGDPHRLGDGAPHLLIRRLEGLDGWVGMHTRWRPRPEYGLVSPLISSSRDGAAAHGGPVRLVLTSPVDLDCGPDSATADFTVAAGEVLLFGMQWSSLTVPTAQYRSQRELRKLLERTVNDWVGWSRTHRSYTGPHSERVWVSGRVLQALTYQPTGAIIAAPTTSLPEEVGGVRNWDYRYTWIRDAAFGMDALRLAACPDEAADFFGFMTSAAADRSGGDPLQTMYGIGGERGLHEHQLPHLSGWRSSAPVRVGNAAFAQYQLDIYGELLDAAARFADQLGDAEVEVRQFLASLADSAAEMWTEPDHGIWEVRGGPRHFLYSKLMCWMALERAVGMAELLDEGGRADVWAAERDRIADAILTEGWSRKAGAFTQSFGSMHLDATALMLPILGFLPADDDRVMATVDAIADRLTDGRGLVFRYRTDDGIEGEEGSFLMCTFWLVQALAMAGRVEEAETVFGNAARCANDLGLLSEEVDVVSGEALGNFPQAFSHIGLINAAAAIGRARGEHGPA